MSEIWREVGGERIVCPIGGHGFRLVESQESLATTEIVSTLERQVILEEMLDSDSKPPCPPGTQRLHYLLATPFRYPPLPHGSRFGGRFEPSLFYAGSSVQVTLCENAYYRFYFYHDMQAPPPKRQLRSQHTLFEFRYRTQQGAKLHSPGFDRHQERLRDPADYSATQALGSAMRNAGIKGFEYRSARDPAGAINIALFDATPFSSSSVFNEKSCICQTTEREVLFSMERKASRFPLDQFLVGGRLPTPAP